MDVWKSNDLGTFDLALLAFALQIKDERQRIGNVGDNANRGGGDIVGFNSLLNNGVQVLFVAGARDDLAA